MKLNIYCVYDKKAAAFGTPFFMSQNGEAIRMFDDLVNDTRSRVNKHPEDYELWNVGQWQDENSMFDNIERVFLVSAASLVKEQKKIVGGNYFEEVIKPTDSKE